MSATPLPTGLYVHYPFCIRKCPYCDFFSKPEGACRARDLKYLKALCDDFDSQEALLNGRRIMSVYLGGGTPSLCDPDIIARLIEHVRPHLEEGCEISMEANPGTTTRGKLRDFREAGVNRLSLGVQSFDSRMLRALGRIHDGAQARSAVEDALWAGFSNLNLDIMHGLPGQDPDMALSDLRIACSYPATHLSWYELTIEEGTRFGEHPPELPDEDDLAAIEDRGFSLLASSGFERYEVSAFARNGIKCLHNRNYWLFGDYLGIGAGASGKVFIDGRTLRRACPEDPQAFVEGRRGEYQEVPGQEIPFEYMLNRLRLYGDAGAPEYEKATGLPFETIRAGLEEAARLGCIELEGTTYRLTAFGRLMLNDVLELFLSEAPFNQIDHQQDQDQQGPEGRTGRGR
ncbi:MAG: radical SAM family heme chaperone HemW [Succinivibrio sp.]